jgi:hypothetical protein
MLFKEIIAVYSENHTKHTKIHSVGKMQSYWSLEQVVHIITLCFKEFTKHKENDYAVWYLYSD